jgi:RNA polymerase sigma-70 factor (ECF subfamily)
MGRMERDLIARAKAGDHDAFTALVESSIGGLYRTARLILRADDLAQDAVQDALIRAWTGIRALRDPDRFEAWLRRLLVRACYTAAKRERARRHVEIRSLGQALTIDPDGHRALAVRDELERAFRRLPPDQRAVLVVRFYLDLPDAEAADVLGIPIGTMKSRLNRARSAMRAALDAEERHTAHAEERTA